MTSDPLHVIIVDDDAVDRMALRRRLQTMPHVIVHEATNTAACVDCLESLDGRRRLLLLDIRLEGNDNGLDLLHELRADPRFRREIVFVLSSSDSAADVERAYDELASGFMRKDASGEYVERVYDLVGLYAGSMQLHA